MQLRSPRHLARFGTAASMVLAAATLLAACNITGSGLVGPTWHVTAVTTTVPAWQGVVPAADQSRYTIAFANDGTAAITADCNQVTATYTTSPGGSISIVPGASTLAMCLASDTSGDGQATVDEVVRAIGAALEGCS